MSVIGKPNPAIGYFAIPPFARDVTVLQRAPGYGASLPTFLFQVDRGGHTLAEAAFANVSAFNILICGRDRWDLVNGAEYIGVLGWTPITVGERVVPGTTNVRLRFGLQV